jgi:hypothetical protein
VKTKEVSVGLMYDANTGKGDVFGCMSGRVLLTEFHLLVKETNVVVGGSETAVVEIVRVVVGVALLFVSAALYKTIIKYVNSAVKKHTGDSQ